MDAAIVPHLTAQAAQVLALILGVAGGGWLLSWPMEWLLDRVARIGAPRG
jgi:hypothetical protein